ncbi:uncharacterized protein LOC109803245 [Cajanus cajan]|uniref:uncharacterized protein LOC109803245 n=1 Tax=Cajanus cajan TaxID=3821 RepID=UPI00098D7E1C|nr:uncharacterized protein LOC109803245 [Cajanus cajan]XP_020220323.1 uncharacterized protein LOC109803245 [Cajanus cajan]XP_020220324.1 uncharacterized protein LOC109803245 [Cajanus cajan]XP_020220325.1 uncharacterized protein LOC109803245 [Cajanus cajan]XP_020220326.1 uncharacterized protein LOC109803245 [Cajanus cajan]
MPLSSNSPSVKVGLAMNQNALSSSENHERSLKPEEDKEEGEEGEEEEDEDFNPFLKDTPSQEASSSLSSEVDGLDGNVVTSGPSVDSDLSKIATKEPICTVVDTEHGEEEIILQYSGMISQSEINQEKHNDLTRATNGNGSRTGELSNKTKSRSPVIDIDNEDAICMRTRARYSLASFTLDELETFLQETDDDDDLQNADDEEEYKRFLAAVLQSGDGDGLSNQENENLDDDEDNDVDFEIELEELLESDADDNASVRTRKEYDGAGRRPETRQNKRQKVSTLCEKKTIGEVKKPLRPILPNWLNGPLPSGKGLIPEATLSFQSSASGNGLVNGFTAQQIGQLHCLIHEHVQLLIQVFSLSVLEPSQKQVASQVQGLLSEMLHKRDEILSLKRVPYPSVCFSPSFSHSSVSNGGSKLVQAQCNKEYAPPQDVQNMCFSQFNRSSLESLNRQRSCLQATESSFWVPFVRSPVQSILDVSPLNLVRRYVDDVSSAAQEFRKRYIASGCDSPVEKEPLFPFSSSMAEANGESSSGTISRAVNAASTSPGKQKPKKTLAAMLVESTKKQSIALVPKEVAKLAQRFLVLFNPALFPHKPPPAAVVNRILFTDSEDELLALGIMEYNTDWKAIQQRFLPCKSKHQIFVRQKNRCSSKASENPIKAVRRMKTSPLTAEEIACVQEGLKIYKFDWMSVWQYIVPHRDPSLLPRQWRIALGTQKSYKIDASKREKRRLYESKRRKLKAAALESWQAISDKEECDADIAGSECMDYSEVPYVHQAFLADWRPDTSTLNYSERISTTSGEGNMAHNAFPQDIQFYRGTHDYGSSGRVQHQSGNQSAFPSVSKLPQFTTSDLRNGMNGAPSGINPKKPVFDVTSGSKYYCRPYRSRKAHNAHLVKLAPDLPPVNLPPSVRVVSQTAFKGFQCGTSKVYPPGGSVAACRKDNSAPHGEKYENVHLVKGASPALKDSVTGSHLERSETVEGISIVAEKGTCTDLQMHPLLFQVTEDGNVPYYPLKFSSGSSSSFSFFSGNQPQLNLSLFHSSQQQSPIDCANQSIKSKDSTSRSGGIDFHPLLQKSDDMPQSPTNFDAIPPESQVNSGVPAMANTSSGLNDKCNELDLEIHLSSVSGREKCVKSRQPKAHDLVGSKKTVAISGTAMKPQEDSVPYCQKGVENLPASTCELASSAPLVVPNDNIARYDVDDIGDQSHPGIVMEQEELSDSEEDIEEHVEFECEEMTDSEGEDGSGCEQALEVQNKEVPISSEENVVKCMADMKKPREPRANSDTQVDGGLLTNNTIQNITLTSEGQDDRSCSSWLSLDSCSADNPVLCKATLQRSTIGEASASRNFSVGKAVKDERHTIDMVQLPNIGRHVSTTPRKSRKRSGKVNANLNIGLTVESSSREVNHENG